MSEHEQSFWVAPEAKPVKSAHELYAERYPDADNTDDMDEMVAVPGAEASSAEVLDDGESPEDSLIGTEIKVERSDKTIEGGWEIIAKEGDRYLVYKEDAVQTVEGLKPGTKYLTLDRIHQLNPELHESSEVLRAEVAEDLSETALEAVGIDEPAPEQEASEVNEHAQVFTRDQMRAMREASAARRSVEDEAPGHAPVEAPAEPVEAAEAPRTAQESLDALKASLDDDDILHLEAFARAAEDKKHAQQEGDGQGSRDAQESMGWHQQRMSSAAVNVRFQFAQLYAKANR